MGTCPNIDVILHLSFVIRRFHWDTNSGSTCENDSRNRVTNGSGSFSSSSNGCEGSLNSCQFQTFAERIEVEMPE